MNFRFLLVPASSLLITPLFAQSGGTEIFEKEIRPVLVAQCYGCHSSKSKSPMGGLALDTKAGLSSAAKGRLMKALSYADPQLRMPPTGKLTAAQLSGFEKWMAAGAPDPRVDVPGTAAITAKKGMDLETGRKWWSFQPVSALAEPKVADPSWPKSKLDYFILAKLEERKLTPSPQADRGRLIERASLDLVGVRPTFEEVQAFVKDAAPGAYERLIDRLLASPEYGERWARYWLDVARFGEDNPTSEATNPAYPFAWRYRDWVVESINRNVPYDRFVKLQLAADLMPGVPRPDLRALGFLGAAPTYHKDARLSKDVIETIYSDDWDERVDTVSRGLLGLSVACARCHDHKFDPITTKDYYGMAGVFASTVAVPRPVKDVDSETETRFMAATQKLFNLSYLANLMRNEPGSKPEEAIKKSEAFTTQMNQVKEEMAFLKEGHPEMFAYLERLAKAPKLPGAAPVVKPAPPLVSPVASLASPASAVPEPAPAPSPPPPNRRGGASEEPFMNTVFDAGLWIDGTDPDLTKIDIRPGQSRDLPVFQHGSVTSPGDPAPRHFLTVLAKSDPAFHEGSGRLELAERIFSDGAPLAARVMVNRVWAMHFGKPLVATASDFGTQGEKPSNPELLDDLAARFISNGWSLKWLNKEIMLSATYRQDSRPRADGLQADPTNQLTWRMNPRRVDIEAYRDSLLKATGNLDEKLYGPSKDLDAPENVRRTIYGRVSRSRLNTVLALYDFPDPTMHSPGRELTTTPLQQLFVMNSPFLHDRAVALVKLVENEPDTSAKIHGMYQRLLNRDPSPKELDLALSFLNSPNSAPLDQYAQALLSSNEVIFWP